jgi:hypothetical protein
MDLKCEMKRESKILGKDIKFMKNTKNEIVQIAPNFIKVNLAWCVLKNSSNSSWDDCHDDDTLDKNHRQICHNVYSMIEVRTVGSRAENDKVYFPSNCVCELVIFPN